MRNACERNRNLAGGGMNVHFQAAKQRPVSIRNACRLALFELLVGRQGGGLVVVERKAEEQTAS